MKLNSRKSWRGWLVALAICNALVPAVRATTVIPPDFAQLVNESDYIVRAVVKSVTSEWRPSAGGRKIITKVALEVREVVAGTPPAEVVLEMLGGQVGDEAMVLEGAPQFEVGEDSILFVSGNGRTIVPLVAMMHGRYPVLREGATGREYVARNNRVPLADPAEVALPMADGSVADLQRRMSTPAQALTPAQFTARIKAAVNPNYARARLE